MLKKSKKKIIYIFMIIMALFSNLQNVILAKEIGDSAKLKSVGHCNRNIEFKFDSGWSIVKCDYIGYVDGKNTYPAYCILHGKDGVEDIGSYTVDLTKILDDVRLYRVIINGFPYKTPSQLGVEDEYDAYMATKQAINCVMLNRNVKSLYKGINSSGDKVVDAIAKLTDIGRNGTQTFQTANLKVTKSGNLVEEGDYYSQTFKVESAVQIGSYDILSTANMPNGSYIANTSGTKKTSFNGNENFKLMIPKSSLSQDINPTINVMSKCKTYPVFFGKTTVANSQNYAITSDPFGDYTAKTTLNVKTNTGKIKIVKADSETKLPIEGVTFKLTKEDGTVVANATTNSEGIATFSSLYQGKYILKEIATNNNYILDESEFDVDVEYNKIKTVNIQNEHKRGDLKVYKTDKDNNKIVLENVEFQLYSEEFKKIIGTYYTDANGELEIKDLRIGNYKLIETKTNKWYNLAEDTDIEIKWDEETTADIENELKKGQVKIIKGDEENNEIKLEGVEFEVLDKNDNVLEKLITNENGEALTSKYAVRDFEKLKIRETKTLDTYVLSDKVETIQLEENQIKDLIFENKKIKGYIQVIKTSSGDNKITGDIEGSLLEGVIFEIYDLNDNKVDEIITDKNGQAISKELLKGTYVVKEKESADYYLLNTDEYTAEIVGDGEIITLNIKNEPENPDVDIEKTGIIQTTANQEIRYDFKIKNTGNVSLDNFIWYDYLPTDYVTITKLITGTYNQELNYSIYYKTNKNDYKLLKDNLNTVVNNYIDFSDIKLEEGEVITEFKADFGTVNVGFESVINPYIFVTVNDTVMNDDNFTNKTRIEGKHKGYLVWDEDDHTTKVYEKEIHVKKLPRTGC